MDQRLSTFVKAVRTSVRIRTFEDAKILWDQIKDPCNARFINSELDDLRVLLKKTIDLVKDGSDVEQVLTNLYQADYLIGWCKIAINNKEEE